MSNTNKSEKKTPRRRYFRRGDAKTNEFPSVNEPPSQTKELDRPEKPKRSSSSGEHSENRSSRRRSRSERKRARSDSTSQRSGSGLRPRTNSDARRRRQKRRRREREDKIAAPVESGPSIIEAIVRDYEPPDNIYTYTHIIRPDQRDTYEFRSDHFSHTSRHLEDYAIDLSPILTETGEIALKKFFQDIPNEDLDRMDSENYRKRSNAKTDIDTGSSSDPFEDDFAIGFDEFFGDDFQDDPDEDFEEGEEKSLEQIYDELEMFKDMEI